MTTSPAPPPRAPRHHGAPHPPSTDPGAVRGFRTPVRGHAFAARPPDGVAVLGRQRMPVRLVREDTNPVDALAVAVWVTAPTPWRIGYLDRVVAARIAPLLDAGHRVEAQLAGRVEAPGGWERPMIAVTDVSTTRRAGDAGDAGDASPRPGRLWGRPPGVERRTVPTR